METKQKVLKSAAELISNEGYYNISVREIYEAAGIQIYDLRKENTNIRKSKIVIRKS